MWKLKMLISQKLSVEKWLNRGPERKGQGGTERGWVIGTKIELDGRN